MSQEKDDLLASLNEVQHARWRAAHSEWYDVYNPHIADLTAMHREQMLFDIANRPAFTNQAASMTSVVLPHIHRDAIRLLRHHLGAETADVEAPFAGYYYMHQGAHGYNIDAAITDVAISGSAVYAFVGDLMRDRRLRPRHVRELLGTRPEHQTAIHMALCDIVFNPLRDSRQSQDEAEAMIDAWDVDARGTLRALCDVVTVEPLVRLIAAYLWEPRPPAALVA
jgi:hypothetical protein